MIASHRSPMPQDAQPTRMLRLLLIGMGTLAALHTTAVAAELEVTHRITGLFSTNRLPALTNAIARIPGVQLVRLDFDHAEGVFRYDPAKSFPVTKPADLDARFNDLLRGASHYTLGIQPVFNTPKDHLQRIVIPVTGLDCNACCLAAYECIFQIDGVAQATASFKEGRITALIDPQKTDRSTLESTLRKRGVSLPTAAP